MIWWWWRWKWRYGRSLLLTTDFHKRFSLYFFSLPFPALEREWMKSWFYYSACLYYYDFYFFTITTICSSRSTSRACIYSKCTSFYINKRHVARHVLPILLIIIPCPSLLSFVLNQVMVAGKFLNPERSFRHTRLALTLRKEN